MTRTILITLTALFVAAMPATGHASEYEKEVEAQENRYGCFTKDEFITLLSVGKFEQLRTNGKIATYISRDYHMSTIKNEIYGWCVYHVEPLEWFIKRNMNHYKRLQRQEDKQW